MAATAPAPVVSDMVFTATACDPAVRNELQRSLKDAQQAAKIDAITTDRLIDQVATAVAHQLMDAYAAKAAARDPRFAQPPAAPAAGATTPTTGTSPPADGTSLGMAALELSSLIPSTASLGQAVTDASRAAYNARAVQLDVHYARVVQRAMTDEQSRAERKQQDIDEEALAVGGSIRASKLAENSYLLRPDTGCAGLIYLMDWIEGLEEKAGSPPQVSLSVHLQRTQKGFGLQIGYSAELRQLVVEGVYDFVQSSEGWPVCKGDILKAVDKHDLAPNNNGQWLIDNVVKTFQNIQEKTRVSFLRPVTNEHARVLRAIRRSLARLFHLERDVTRWYPQLGVLYIRSLLERLNTAFIAMYTRPCGTVAAKASNDPSRDDARAVEAARLRGWVRVSALLDVEVANLERGMAGAVSQQGIPVVLQPGR